MPIDPSIAGQAITRQQPFDLLGALNDVSMIKARQSAAAKMQREQQTAEQMQALASQYPDPEDFIREVSKIDPMKAQEFNEQYQKARTQKLTGHEKALAVEKASVDRYLRMLQAAEDDPNAYGGVRMGLVQLSPEYDQILPTPDKWAADPAVRQRVMSMGDTVANNLKVQQDATAAFLKGDYRRGLLDAVSQSPTIDVARSYLEKARGVAPKGDIAYVEGILASAPDFETARTLAGQAALTAEQRAQASSRATDDTRQAERDERMSRHYDAMESQARATNARLSAGGGSGGGSGTSGSASDADLIEAIIANPTIYGGLTPTIKSRLAGPLAKRGFTGFAATSAASGKAGPDVTAIFNEIDTLSKRINTSEGSPLSNVAGMARRGMASGNMDNDVSEYQSLVEGMIPMVARAVGHTGVLTQQDVESVRAMFPKVGDNKVLAENKLKRVRGLIGGSGTAAAAGPKEGDTKPIDGYPGTEQTYRGGKWIRTK